MTNSSKSAKIVAARFSVAVAVLLATVKFVVAFLTGSMAVLASAVDSLLDIFMSGINFFAIRQAEQPADENHPFGHGKFETVATLVQSLVIALSGLWIIKESSERLITGSQPSNLSDGVLVLTVSAGVSWWISRYLRRVARQTESSALQADSLHFSMDVYTNLGLVAGLLLIGWLHLTWLDPLLSILVALYILYEAVGLIRHGLKDALDEELPGPLRQQIDQVISAHCGDLIGYHNLRTRRAGSQKIMDFHLTVCKHLSVEEAHSIADAVEKEIESKIFGSDVTIHIEPCQRRDCPGRDLCRGG